MSNLKTFDNIYANLSHSTYEKTYNFEDHLLEIDKGKQGAKMNYYEDYRYGNVTILGGQNLPNNGVLNVHKDKIVDRRYVFNGHQITEQNSHLLSDVSAGFQSYFLTDTPQLNSETKNVY